MTTFHFNVSGEKMTRGLIENERSNTDYQQYIVDNLLWFFDLAPCYNWRHYLEKFGYAYFYDSKSNCYTMRIRWLKPDESEIEVLVKEL